MNLFKRSILIVDDNEMNRSILADILSDSYNTFEASNGLEALEFLKKETVFISAILLDIQMPVMDGFEFLKNLNKLDVISRIPVIITTSLGDQESEKRCLEIGAVDFIRKPYDSYVVLTRLQNSIILRESTVDLNLVKDSELSAFYQWNAFCKHGEILLKQNRDSKYDILVFRIYDYANLVSKYGDDLTEQYLEYIGDQLLLLKDCEMIVSHFDLVSFAILIKQKPELGKTNKQLAYEFKKLLDTKAPINDAKLKCAFVEDVNHDDSVAKSCSKAFKLLEHIKGVFAKSFIEYSGDVRKEIELLEAIEQNMVNALKEKQFEVYYQPKYYVAGEKNIIAGAEGLIRWIHPKLGFMNPGVFIPLFEQNGFITQVDIYMLDRICSDLREWIDDGRQVFPISINVSRVDFSKVDLANTFINIVESYKIPHDLIHFEITESAFSSKDDLVRNTIHTLHENGFIIELDDFGSGYSTLYSLQSLDLDIVKLDLSLIKNDDINSEKNTVNFAYSLVKMLKMKTVQEGVETKEQLERVRSLGCDYVQGYYFSKPLCKKDFEIFCKDNLTKE